MHPLDLLALEKVNLDPLTETYHIGFYLEYLAKWPHLCRVIVGRDGEVEAYSKFCLFGFLRVWVRRTSSVERTGSG